MLFEMWITCLDPVSANSQKCAGSQFHPKTLIEIAIALSTNSGSFPSNSHVSATFSILLTFGEFWNPTNCENFNADGSLMGRTNLDKYFGLVEATPAGLKKEIRIT